jgi:hypothetical protein
MQEKSHSKENAIFFYETALGVGKNDDFDDFNDW